VYADRDCGAHPCSEARLCAPVLLASLRQDVSQAWLGCAAAQRWRPRARQDRAGHLNSAQTHAATEAPRPSPRGERGAGRAAGVAGLSCGAALAAAGVRVALLEASDGVGGRVRTDALDGFTLDRGFQIFLTSYPEAERALDYAALDLRPFYAGAPRPYR
jgi:hypothetical protein